jgi:Dolichyl-phosphate-mannose-protein mannosyltransferase
VETERGLAAGELGQDGAAAVEPAAPTWPEVAVAVPRTYAREVALILAGLVLLSIAVRALLARRIETPWIMVDELLYSELAKSFAERGELLIRDLPYGRLSLLYPVVIAPAWLADSMETVYDLAKTLNAVVMSLAAVPVYLWARRLVSPGLSLVAAVLVLLLPVYVYTGTLMTENAFFPAFVLAAYAFALALERPTLATQAFALAAAATATAVRTQGIVLFAIFLLAIVLKVGLDLRAGEGPLRRAARPYLASLGAVAALVLVYVAYKLAQGADLASGLGAYAGVSGAGYSATDGVRWTLRHAAELGLALGVIPVAALIVLAGLAVARGLPGAAERAFVAVAVSAVLLLVVQVGIYASRFIARIEERNMIHVAPILLLALVLWIGRGLPRPPVLAACAALVPAALLLLIPLGAVLNQSILSDTFALIPLLRVDQLVSGGVDEVRWLMVAGGFAAALLFLFVPRRWGPVVLPVALALYFAVATNSVLGAVSDFSSRLRALVPPNASWVDTRIGSDADAPYLFGTTPDPFAEAVALWQLEFWNRSLAGVYGLGVPPQAGIPELQATIDRSDGRITSASPGLEGTDYVVTQRTLDLAERPLLVAGTDVLYAVDDPLQAESATAGVYADGWMSSDATYDRYVGPKGVLDVSLSRRLWNGPDKPGRALIEVGPLTTGPDGLPTISRVTARRAWTIHAGAQRTFRLPTPRPPFRARVHIEPTFSPVDYGRGDVRQLGAQVTFGFAADR